jgi:hypothetical protein
MRNTADVTGGKPIAVFLQSISGVSAINPVVAFYDIHGGTRGAILLFCPGRHTTQVYNILLLKLLGASLHSLADPEAKAISNLNRRGRPHDDKNINYLLLKNATNGQTLMWQSLNRCRSLRTN